MFPMLAVSVKLHSATIAANDRVEAPSPDLFFRLGKQLIRKA
jgi:hypothetical protein